MACGTPVIAYDRGSMAELIDHGGTGFLVGDLAGATRAVGDVEDLDRSAIRASTVRRFDRSMMVARYVAVYHEVLDGHVGQVGAGAIRG